ncbi:two-component system response regulator [Streptomyces viridochromogenes DSM 40736]|uniref:Two-component system response regulator n=1 Tax=Streptomyces viridochromogenes (strain DSM 40736 / JCM 4977 / BCRC 1201 / Tue 494) TaxID=591159 RepID=D9WZ37_STRVT|nr:two-component system response regulator [Streptomyces viridochromogenes DSM 40736]
MGGEPPDDDPPGLRSRDQAISVASKASAAPAADVSLPAHGGCDVRARRRVGDRGRCRRGDHAAVPGEPDRRRASLAAPARDPGRIRAEYPGTQVVVLTTYADDESLFPALAAGARGYLTKDAGGEVIVRAVHSVLSGEAGLSPSVQRRLLERLAEGGTRPPAPPEVPDGLTARETEVLVLIADGLSNQEIARRLHVSTATVKTHINNLFTKTGLKDRAQAVRYAYGKGLVRPPAG